MFEVCNLIHRVLQSSIISPNMKITELKNFLSKTITSEDFRFIPDELEDPDELEEFLPTGWHKFVEELFQASMSHQRPMSVGKVTIKDGVLYSSIEMGKPDNREEVHKKLFVRISTSLMQESAKTCMVCGKFGKRRKELEHKPSLCPTHYLEYINL
jgi:hypothetical protein